jgi:predicted phage terminase large subunit-like protein
LAVGFGRKVRNLVDQDTYREIFPGVGLQTDSKAAGRWATNKGGDYFAIGVGGAVTGKGADILIIDDPHSEQEAAQAEINPEIYDKTYEWYTSGPRQRLQPGGAIIIVMTRWSKKDLTGQVIKAASQRSGEEWEVIEFPALLPSGKPLWPQFWPRMELEALQKELPHGKWMAQYQQNPTSESSAIVKREWWQVWEDDEAPNCEFTLMAWDTAFEKSNRADYSALTHWGVFYHPDDTGLPQANIILLNAFRERMEFPKLKQTAIDQFKEWEPDSVIIEKKASGAPLIYEMRAMGIPVQEFTPSKGNDKISRLNAVSDLFASGRVWAPNTHWAEEVIEEVASFPAGEHDDYVDSVSLALMRFRKGGYIRTLLDEEDELPSFKRHFEGYY